MILWHLLEDDPILSKWSSRGLHFTKWAGEVVSLFIELMAGLDLGENEEIFERNSLPDEFHTLAAAEYVRR